MEVRDSTELSSSILMAPDDYVLFDCPGQVELFTHHGSLRNIFFRLQKLGYRVFAHHPWPATGG